MPRLLPFDLGEHVEPEVTPAQLVQGIGSLGRIEQVAGEQRVEGHPLQGATIRQQRGLKILGVVNPLGRLRVGQPTSRGLGHPIERDEQGLPASG